MLLELQERGFTPPALANRPSLPAPLRWYLEAFYDLSRSRPITMGGVGPIPLSEVLAYMQMFGIDGYDDRLRFLSVISQMDNAYLKREYEKQQAKSK